MLSKLAGKLENNVVLKYILNLLGCTTITCYGQYTIGVARTRELVKFTEYFSLSPGWSYRNGPGPARHLSGDGRYPSRIAPTCRILGICTARNGSVVNCAPTSSIIGNETMFILPAEASPLETAIDIQASFALQITAVAGATFGLGLSRQPLRQMLHKHRAGRWFKQGGCGFDALSVLFGIIATCSIVQAIKVIEYGTVLSGDSPITVRAGISVLSL
ncbi:hypothetical protein BJ170DRAFT_724304 [Xylariales sp. AK1849]|nr:hypothetical protein BJ170DRAFT_724304 [Xylariales sp. AK1849]